jgi:hypothetical protein
MRTVALASVFAVLGCVPAAAHRSRPAPAVCAGVACQTDGRGKLRGGDERGAAAQFMMGCDSGDGASCADLAALYAAGRGVRRDDGRACELGLAEACRRVGRPEPATARTQSWPLPQRVEVGAAPRAAPVPLEDALDWGRYHVEEEWLGPLGFTREALGEYPAAPIADQLLARAVIAPRLWAVERCLPVLRGEREAWPARGFASVVLEPDGRVRAPAATVEDHPGCEATIACAVGVLRGWEFPLPLAGGRIWFELEGRGQEVRLGERAPLPKPKGPVVKPRMQVPGCVASRVALPPDARASIPNPVTVKFSVERDGSVRRFQMKTRGVPLDAIRAIERAVQSCGFEPGIIGGEPASIWVLLPIRFALPSAPPASW